MVRPKLAESFPDWVKIPAKMQHQFFELAEREAGRLKARLLEDRAKLLEVGKLLKFNDVPESDEWRGWRIGVVDGSDSPVMSERVGGRFGTYGATYHIFEGDELVEEEYFSGQLVDSQIGDPEASKKLLSLMATKLERDVALICLERDVDLLLIDGSFFGFRPRCRIIHDRKVAGLGITGLELVNCVREATSRLLGSGKAVGVIKRVQTAAIDGWLIVRNGDKRMATGRNDKHILSSLMGGRRFFSYESAFGDPILFNYLTRLALAFDRYAAGKTRSLDSILEACKNDVERNVRRDLLCEPAEIFRTTRHFVRCNYPAEPFCFETPIGFKLEPLLAYFQSTHNKATGLPIALDLTDQDVTLPSGFTREFVEEIEARLLKDSEMDKFELANHFASLNPQKQE